MPRWRAAAPPPPCGPASSRLLLKCRSSAAHRRNRNSSGGQVEPNQHQDPTAKRYAEEHLRYLKEARPDVLAGLRQSGKLDSYLSSVGNQASERLDHVMSQHMVSKEVQDLPYHQQVRELQSRHREAEETIRHDLIHQPVPEE